MWWKEARVEPEWIGKWGVMYRPGWRLAGWTERRFHLGNKVVFDAEVNAIYQALRLFEARDENNASYTVFPDSAVAISRA